MSLNDGILRIEKAEYCTPRLWDPDKRVLSLFQRASLRFVASPKNSKMGTSFGGSVTDKNGPTIQNHGMSNTRSSLQDARSIWTMTAFSTTAKAFPQPNQTFAKVDDENRGAGRSSKDFVCRWSTAAFVLVTFLLNTAMVVVLAIDSTDEFINNDQTIAGLTFLALAPMGSFSLMEVRFADAVGLIGFAFWYFAAFLLNKSDCVPLVAVMAHLVFNLHRHWTGELGRGVGTLGAVIAQIVIHPNATIAYSLMVVWFSVQQFYFVGEISYFSGRTERKRNRLDNYPSQERWLILSVDEENTQQIRDEIDQAKELVEAKRPGMKDRISRLEINFNDLKLAERIGFGSFGEVYRAVLSDDQIVAVKRIPRTQLSRNKIVSMFTEIDVVASCSHPNVVTMVGWSDDPYVLVCLEFANGGSLKDFLHSTWSKLDVGWCLTKSKMALDAASGLAYLHSRGLIHRDVKIDNFLVFTSGENSIVVKVADFGTSRANDADPLNNPMTPVGSPLWLAPEVARGTKDYGLKADVWSFGVSLCEIATHSAPYEDLCTHESFFNLIGVSQGKIFPVEQLIAANGILTQGRQNTTNFGNLCRLVEKCCSYDPEARPLMNGVMFELLQMMVVDEDAMNVINQFDQAFIPILGEKSTSFSVRRATSLRLGGGILDQNVEDVLGPLNSPSFAKSKGRISDPTSSRKSGKNLSALFAAETSASFHRLAPAASSSFRTELIEVHEKNT